MPPIYCILRILLHSFIESELYIQSQGASIMEKEGQRRTIKAVRTTFSVVEQLQTRGECGVTELATAMDLPKSTVHKHLRTLEEAGYVRNRDGQYRMGFKFLEQGGIVRDCCRNYRLGRPKVQSLSDRLDEMVILAVLDGDRGVYLFRANDRYNLERPIPLGERFHLHQTASGKAMLAELDDERIDELLEESGLPAATNSTISDYDELMDQLEDV